MKNRKTTLLIFFMVVAVIGLITAFISLFQSAKKKDRIDSDVDISLLSKPLIDETLIFDTISKNNLDMDTHNEIPSYYHSVSDIDDLSIYLGGVGNIYKINSESEVQTLYSTPNIAGAALYGDYVFSLEYNILDDGMTIELIRINKKGFDKKVLTQVNSGSYDLRIIDNTLIISEDIIGDYGLETIYQAYTLNDEGDLISDMPEDVYSQFEILNGYGEGMHFLINPWFSTKYFGYFCFVKRRGETDIKSIWISKENYESTEEVVTCSGEPLVTKDRIFFCNSDGEILMQHSLDNSQEKLLYEIPRNYNLLLLTYDTEWVYFLQIPNIDVCSKLPSSVMRVNLRDHRTEEIYKLQMGDFISNFNVYGNKCYFILSSADNSSQWECCDLIDFTVTTIH